MTTTTHPATFSNRILDVIRAGVVAERRTPDGLGVRDVNVLDPFGGTGRIHEIAGPGIWTTAVEIEPEWVDYSRDQHPGPYTTTICSDSLVWATSCGQQFDVIATSPVYPNACGDPFVGDGKSKRNTYASHLGRLPTTGSSAGMGRWSSKASRRRHMDFNIAAWAAFVPLLKPGGAVILNVKDSVYTHRGQTHVGPFTAWCWELLTARHNMILESLVSIPTRGLAFGANATARTGYEYCLTFRQLTTTASTPQETESL